MPNWCFNEIRFTGSTGDITNLIEFVEEQSDEGLIQFSFNSIIPMPIELKGVASPVKAFKTKVQAEAYNQKYNKFDDKFSSGKAITVAKHMALLKKYGHANWYDWSNDKWGCKWNNNTEGVEMQDNRDNGCVTYSFDTPWGPPEEIFHALREKFPEVHISWFYNEPGMEFSGYLPN